jgi:hypothetical protein
MEKLEAHGFRWTWCGQVRVYNFADCDEREKLEAQGFRWGWGGEIEGGVRMTGMK